MKKRYDEIKKIIMAAGMADVYSIKGSQNDIQEGFEITTKNKKNENESSLGGEVILTDKGKLLTSIHFNVPNGEDYVDITKVKGVKALLKAKKEIEEMLNQLQIDYQVMLAIEKNIAKHDPEILASAKESVQKKKMKI